MTSSTACVIFCALVFVMTRDANCVPLGDEELTKGEMQTQEVEVTYTISRPADDEYVDETANDGEDAELDSSDGEVAKGQTTRRVKGPLPLERAITYPDAVLLPLEFSTHVHRKPKRKNLKKKKLMQKMGDDFDPLWMSIDPVTSGDDEDEDNARVEMSDRQLDQIEQEVSALHLEDELERLTAEHDDSNDVLTTSAHSSVAAKRDLIKVFEQWLVKKSSCPVRFEWEDLGDYFWPRHVRKGACARKPCSWPAGMECAVDEAKTLQLLRWHCRRAPLRSAASRGRRTQHDQHKCRWYKVPYTVTTSCKCACQ
jgi:hypothetical protein